MWLARLLYSWWVIQEQAYLQHQEECCQNATHCRLIHAAAGVSSEAMLQ